MNAGWMIMNHKLSSVHFAVIRFVIWGENKITLLWYRFSFRYCNFYVSEYETKICKEYVRCYNTTDNSAELEDGNGWFKNENKAQ